MSCAPTAAACAVSPTVASTSDRVVSRRTLDRLPVHERYSPRPSGRHGDASRPEHRWSQPSVVDADGKTLLLMARGGRAGPARVVQARREPLRLDRHITARRPRPPTARARTRRALVARRANGRLHASGRGSRDLVRTARLLAGRTSRGRRTTAPVPHLPAKADGVDTDSRYASPRMEPAADSAMVREKEDS